MRDYGHQQAAAPANTAGDRADASLPLHDHGLPLDRIPDVIANTVELIVNQLRQTVVAPQV